ncbi:MAG: lipopolysaccharide transport periplasmic protein LptA [Pseudomonadota bacterium]
MKFDRTQPVEVTADALEVDDIAHTGRFSGNVNVKQGDFRLRSDDLTIIYAKNEDQKASGQTGKIDKLIAAGNVVIQSLQEKAKSNKAIYDLQKSEILLEGDVLVTRADGAISGSRVKIETQSRKIYVLSDPKKRVQAVIKLDEVQK